MNALATINYDREYFDTFYANWVSYRSRWRRFAIPIAITLVALMAMACLLSFSYRPIAGGLLVIAIVNFFDAATYRVRWIRKRLASIAVDKTANFVFTDDNIRISSANSDGTLTYNAFGLVTITPEGIFLVPDSGMSIFIPRTAFSDDNQFREVSSKFADRVAQNTT